MGKVGDFGAVLKPASKWERLVRGVGLELRLAGWASSIVEIFEGGATLRRLILLPFPREANPDPGTPRPLAKVL